MKVIMLVITQVVPIQMIKQVIKVPKTTTTTTTTTIRCHLHLVETILVIIKMTMVRLLTAMETKIFLVSMHQDQAIPCRCHPWFRKQQQIQQQQLQYVVTFT